MPAPLRFSRRALLSSLPLAALPLLYGCGGGSGSEDNTSDTDNTYERENRVVAPLVAGGETVAQVRLDQKQLFYKLADDISDYPGPITNRLSVENTGTRTIADLQFLFAFGNYYFPPVGLNALGPGQVYEQVYPSERSGPHGLLPNIETLISRLRFTGESALGGPYSGVMTGDFIGTGEQNRAGRVYTVVGIDDRIVGTISAEIENPGTIGSFGRISGTVDAAGNITGTLDAPNPPSPSNISVRLRNLSGTLRNEGDGLRLEFSVAPKFYGATRFSAFLRREAG